MGKYYKLEGKKAVPCKDVTEWALWNQKADRTVKKDTINGCDVSTVFLGLCHQFGDGPPLIFETMIFGGPHDQYQDRCSTWEQALSMHQKAINLLNNDSNQEINSFDNCEVCGCTQVECIC